MTEPLPPAPYGGADVTDDDPDQDDLPQEPGSVVESEETDGEEEG